MAFDTVTEIDRVAYDDALADLAGSQKRALLPNLCTQANEVGKVATFDALEPDDEADYDLLSGATDFRADYENGATGLWANYSPLLTPHMDVTLQRTHCFPYRNRWGTHFRDIDEVRRNLSIHSQTLQQGMKRIFKRQDAAVLAALSAATQTRGEVGGTTTTFPTAQTFSESDGIFDKETCLKIGRIFETNFTGADEEPILVAIHPYQKELMIRNSGSTIHSTDFVSRAGYFEKGTLPEIYGVNVIAHPACPVTKAYAWQRSGIVFNRFTSMMKRLAEDPGTQFQVIAFMREYIGSCRVDDKKVIQVTLTGASS